LSECATGLERKGHWRVYMVQMLYAHICKWKTETWNGGGAIKENDRGDEFKYEIFDIL
jgi:hypothetical protein